MVYNQAITENRLAVLQTVVVGASSSLLVKTSRELRIFYIKYIFHFPFLLYTTSIYTTSEYQMCIQPPLYDLRFQRRIISSISHCLASLDFWYFFLVLVGVVVVDLGWFIVGIELNGNSNWIEKYLWFFSVWQLAKCLESKSKCAIKLTLVG